MKSLLATGRICNEPPSSRAFKSDRAAYHGLVCHKRALNRRYDVENKALRMFDGYLNEQGIKTLAEITPALLDAFFPQSSASAATKLQSTGRNRRPAVRVDGRTRRYRSLPRHDEAAPPR